MGLFGIFFLLTLRVITWYWRRVRWLRYAPSFCRFLMLLLVCFASLSNILPSYISPILLLVIISTLVCGLAGLYLLWGLQILGGTLTPL